MRTRWLWTAVPLLACVGYAEDRPAPKARPGDVMSQDTIIKALYDVISGPKGQDRDWDRLRSLFVPGARLIPAVRTREGGRSARVMSVEDFIQYATEAMRRDGFFEAEVARHTDAYGAIAHVFSTYESRHAAADPEPFTRGINSIQLLKDGDRWWVVTIFWDDERFGSKVPAEFLPKR